MDKIEKIRQEIERLKKYSEESKKEWINEGYTQNAFAEDCRITSFDGLLSFIGTLSEEPDKDLEEAAKEYSKRVSDGHNYRDLTCAFIAGGTWKEAQMMKNAKDGWVDEECVIVLNDGTRIDLQPDCEKKPAFEFEYAQDVRVIVLPKED